MASQDRIAGTVVSAGSWTDFTIANLEANDSNFATTNSTTYVGGVLRNFGFTIPTGATILGVAVGVNFGSSAGNATAYLRTRISKDAGSNWSEFSDEASTNAASGDEHEFPGSENLWGLTLSPAEINDNANFYIQVDGRITTANRQCRLDYLHVIVYYTEGSQEHFLTPTDSILLSDSFNSAVVLSLGLLDAIKLMDTAKSQADFIRQFQDAITLSEGVVKSYNKFLHDNVGLQDNVQQLKEIFLEFLDSLSLSDNSLRAIVKLLSLSDSITLSDNLNTIFISQLSLSDSITLSDNFVKVSEYLKSFSDTISLSDTLFKGLTQELRDYIILSDEFDRSLSAILSLKDYIGLSDNIALATILLIELSDSIQLSDQAVHLLSRNLLVQDSITLSETLSKGFSKEIQDIIGLDDANFKDYSQRLSDNLYLWDQVINSRLLSFSDVIALEDALSFEEIGAIFIEIFSPSSVYITFEFRGLPVSLTKEVKTSQVYLMKVFETSKVSLI